MRNFTRMIFAAALVTVAANSWAQMSSGYIKEESHVIDIREYAASLKWEAAPQEALRAPSRTPAPDNIRWIDRIYNLPDFMKAFYDRHGVLVQQVLDGGTNYLSDPDNDNTNNMIHFGDGTVSTILTQVTRKILYTFPVDVDYTDPYAKQQYAVQAINDDLNANVKPDLLNDVYNFLPYMFMSMSYDYPQAFWLGNFWSWGTTYSYSWDYLTAPGQDSVEYKFYVLYNVKATDFDCRIDKFSTAQAVKDGVTEFKGLVNDILKDVPQTTRYAQIKYLNEWLTKNNSYSSAYYSGEFSPIVWSPMSALRGTSGADGPVCEGYARAFKILCNKLNIPCMLAVGDAISSKDATPESHMWDEVKMDNGLWYAVDVTWDDPVVGSGPQSKESGAENESWLLLGKNDIVNDWDNLTFAESHPNSLVYGEDESAAWNFDNETLITDSRYDNTANSVDAPLLSEFDGVSVYSISGLFIGKFESYADALNSINRGIYIINNRKVVIQ